MTTGQMPRLRNQAEGWIKGHGLRERLIIWQQLLLSPAANFDPANPVHDQSPKIKNNGQAATPKESISKEPIFPKLSILFVENPSSFLLLIPL
jgi:hypothetical protein